MCFSNISVHFSGIQFETELPDVLIVRERGRTYLGALLVSVDVMCLKQRADDTQASLLAKIIL